MDTGQRNCSRVALPKMHRFVTSSHGQSQRCIVESVLIPSQLMFTNWVGTHKAPFARPPTKAKDERTASTSVFKWIEITSDEWLFWWIHRWPATDRGPHTVSVSLLSHGWSENLTKDISIAMGHNHYTNSQLTATPLFTRTSMDAISQGAWPGLGMNGSSLQRLECKARMIDEYLCLLSNKESGSKLISFMFWCSVVNPASILCRILLNNFSNIPFENKMLTRFPNCWSVKMPTSKRKEHKKTKRNYQQFEGLADDKKNGIFNNCELAGKWW